MSDVPTTHLDKTTVVNPEVQNKLSTDSQVPPGQNIAHDQTSNQAHVQAGTLPPLEIAGADSSNTHWGAGAMAVASDLFTGAKNEFSQHLGQVVESGAIGLAIGAAATTVADGVVAVAAVAGVTLAAPEVLVGAAVIGAAYGGYELYEHAGGWMHDASVVANPQDHSAADVANAHTGLQDVGGGAVLVGVGIGGAYAGGYISSALASAGAGAGAETPGVGADTSGEAPARGASYLDGSNDAPPTPAKIVATAAVPGKATAVLPADAPAAPAKIAATSAIPGQTAASPEGDTTSDAPAVAAPAASNPEGDAATKAPPSSDAQPAAAEMTPDQQAIADSIKANQAKFTAAGEDNSIITAGKQDYEVRFQKVTEPTQVQTLEGLKTGTTETAQPGQWIATRLNPDGSPNIENGIENKWPIDSKVVLKSYNATPEDLQNSELVASTKTGGPPVHMVQLTEPLTIRTSWGGQTSGEAGDYLVNYNYANGQPGDDFNILTAASFTQTYQEVPTV
jgi:hypothetical protein